MSPFGPPPEVEPEALPAWARPRASGPPLAWQPASPSDAEARAEREGVAEPAPPPAPKPEPADETVGPVGPVGAGEPGWTRAEPTVPEGMLLMSEEELERRDEEVAEAAREPYRGALQRLMRVISELEQRLREDVVDLAARIASVLAQRALELDRSITVDIAQRALRLLGPIERVIIKCAESDAEMLRERLPDLARAEAGRSVEVIVRPSDDIRPGGMVMSFDGGVVDAREERRLERIIEAVKAAVQEYDADFDIAGDEEGEP